MQPFHPLELGLRDTKDGKPLAPATGSASDDVLRMVFAFGDKERQDAVRAIAERVKALESFVQDCMDNFDCDHDAHHYNTTCRACAAAALMPNRELSHGGDE